LTRRVPAIAPCWVSETSLVAVDMPILLKGASPPPDQSIPATVSPFSLTTAGKSVLRFAGAGAVRADVDDRRAAGCASIGDSDPIC